MSSKTKIVVLRMKEIIYTGIFLLLGILLISLFLFMFRPGKKDSPASSDQVKSLYTPGVYTSSIRLGNEQVDVQVSVDSDHINSIDLVALKRSRDHHVPPGTAGSGRSGRADLRLPVHGKSLLRQRQPVYFHGIVKCINNAYKRRKSKYNETGNLLNYIAYIGDEL